MGKGWLLSPTANIWPFKLLVCLPPSLSSLSLFVENRKEQSRVNPLSLSPPVENRVRVTSETNLLQLEKAKEILLFCNLPTKYCRNFVIRGFSFKVEKQESLCYYFPEAGHQKHFPYKRKLSKEWKIKLLRKTKLYTFCVENWSI